MRYVLGLDAGGTKTVALLAGEDGVVVGEARAGGANLHTHGELEVEKVLHDVMERAAGARPVTAVCLGMAGVDRPRDEMLIRGILRRLGHRDAVRVANDAVIALVAGYAIGGGHVLHVVCDLSIAADNAIFGQVGPKMGSFDGGFGSSYLARVVGQKKAREIWFLCRQYNAQQALEMGLVNTVVPVAQLEAEGVKWASEIMEKSPLAIRLLKSGFNAELDGQAGIQELAGNATLLYYMSEEAKEFHAAQREKRKPNARKYPWLP